MHPPIQLYSLFYWRLHAQVPIVMLLKGKEGNIDGLWVKPKGPLPSRNCHPKYTVTFFIGGYMYIPTPIVMQLKRKDQNSDVLWVNTMGDTPPPFTRLQYQVHSDFLLEGTCTPPP